MQGRKLFVGIEGRYPSNQRKEMDMNASKVIELGKVSEETKGSGNLAESPEQPFRGEG
jgi:hypothetical protein